MSSDSWWTHTDRDGFTKAAAERRPQMEQGKGAQIARQLSWDSAGEQQDKNERKGGKWGTRHTQS